MNIQQNVSLAPYTSFQLGGPAEQFVEVHDTDELIEVLKQTDTSQIWLLGYGSNTLISDQGLPGLTIAMHGGKIVVDDRRITADAGVWWDDVVKTAIDQELWGIELMSEIPGSVGAATFINITAYGQSIGPLIEGVDVWDASTMSVKHLGRHQLTWDYKKSIFQKPENTHLTILRTYLTLNRTKQDITYQKALDVATELNLDVDSLEQRRTIIIEARRRAGSLWNPDHQKNAHTVGSFFRNPVVSKEHAEAIIRFDESGKTADEVKKMNRSHGGSEQRVSAAHVMLAAGFKRGQRWNNVKLNEQNLLKIEALPGASSQEVYDVAREIQLKVKEDLGITLEPEARILGNFDR